MKLVSSREDISDLLKRDDLSDEDRKKFNLILKLRVFIEEHLGMELEENYSTYVDLKRNWVVKVLTVSEKCKIDPYYWSFPIVGSVPYLGFFNENSALEKEKEFKDKGYDTYLRNVAAYSTLGWFSDSVLSTFLRYKPHYLVSTIIHESVHLNIFKKDDMEFNENIAVFIEEEATKLFLGKEFGRDSKIFKDYIQSLKNSKERIKFFKDSIKELSGFYEGFEKCGEDPSLRNKKFLEIEKRFFDRFKYKTSVNNAFLASISLYNINYEELQSAFTKDFNENIVDFIKHYKEKYD